MLEAKTQPEKNNMTLKPTQFIENRYKVIEHLGQGGMGAVWKALDTKHDDEVVIKMPLFEHDSKILKRFKREAQVMRKHSIESPHILNIEDIGEHEGIPWYVMRYLPGGSVADRALVSGQDGKIQWDSNSFNWLTQIASALDYLHQKGAYHRDVKPENILFSKNGTPYLVDFGIVKTVNETTSMVTDQGTAIGTMAYMAPENLEGQPFSPQSDQYSLAVTLYEYLTGERPFAGTTFFALFKSLQQGHRKLSELAPAIPQLASDSVDRALSADASERFESCGNFANVFINGMMADSVTKPPRSSSPAHTSKDKNKELESETSSKSIAKPKTPRSPDKGAASVKDEIVAAVASEKGTPSGKNNGVDARTPVPQPEAEAPIIATLAPPSSPAPIKPKVPSPLTSAPSKSAGKEP